MAREMAIATGALFSGTTLQRLSKNLPQLVSMLLVIACGYTLAQFSWQLYTQMQDQPAAVAQAVAPAKTRSAASSTQQKVSQITSSHLFGKSSARSIAAPSKAPVTKLNLVLRGVLAAEPSSMASAIIASGKGGKEEIYGIGDKIQNGVKLSEIHNEHVIIDRQGRLEKLAMEKSRGSTASVASSRNNRNTSMSNPTSLRDIRSQIIKNPTSFGEYALPVVVKENGKQVGYRLKPQKKGALLAKSGIQPSDVITEINGVKLDNPQNGIKALRELSSANSVNLTVKRGQSFLPLKIQLQ